MKIILKENIENLGNKGDIVNVAAGYGRNYLLPKKLALKVTSSNMKMIEMEQAALKKNLEKARISYKGAIQKLNEVSLSFERKAGEKDTIFGSVSVADIKEELDKLGFEIEKKKILLKEPVKKIGSFTVPIKVFLDDIAEIKIQVIPEGLAAESALQKDITKDTPKVPEETAKKKSVTKASKEEAETDIPEEKKEEVVEEEKAADGEPSEETPEEKEPQDPVLQEDQEAVQKDSPAQGEEEKPEPEPEEVPIETASSEETVKDEEKDESHEKNKTS
ncbi:MAG: 50S ribosomal protein L9 [Candidatus Aminicenantaceae bacterium]